MARSRRSNPAPKNAQSYLAGTTSAPFPDGEHQQIAVKVIDPRGNELLVIKQLEQGK
ncbi:MAG: hypothetical protein ACLQVW_24560 [Limisphaerales bacterium]